ncbi:uncharacterized protein PITG_11119 [Phytophthora infestans T30-4]|uniref:Uncharacterized protein n=1 Tax=Phytophthora infestans (strain T30-4) TaxID=403677 RepID=D0NG81_PHYIT|nr:uncharacterized protein PITG_11119 [Phytophthora infestans T30-4]EEY57282.1 conserved hypothetical protein [Phytophthora infestans T30-4]|eukprot:XP_002901892.1 conserved hypothetical protein [Phytophthora infestans T30-4]
MRSAKAVRSDQPFRAGKQQSLRRYVSAGSSPVALTPNFSSLSPLYPLPGSPHSAGSSPCSTSLDDAIGHLFTRYLPTFFDLLEKFQYQKALLIVEDEEETRWKSWNAVKVMLKLGASCESTYHLMKYLEAELVQSDTIEQMYGKLVVLMNHLADELKPIVARQSRHFPVHTPTPPDSMLMMEIAMCGDMNYYVELLEQGAEFFSLRVPMIQIYRGLALSSVPRDYHSMLKRLENLLLRFDAFDHPLLETMKQSAIEELSTLHAAIQCEVRVAEYDFTRSIVALHRLKVQLRSWSDHIDGVSDYPLFEGNGVDFGAGGEEEGLLLDESDENYGVTSDSMYSNTSYQSSSSLARGHMLNSSLSGESHHASGIPGIPSSLAESLVSYRGGRYANMGDTSYDIADEMALLEGHHSGVSLNSASPASSETHSTFRRLLSHSSLLRRGGLASALPIRRGLVQKPGDPYVSSIGASSSTPTITLEQAILGGGTGTGGSGGVAGGSTNPVAAEMMASSMKRQERDDGFALPVFQWSKRFYRSLVAKFSLYFHRWLEPFEKKTDFLTLELPRFIRTPLGISYLGLMDVLLSRAQRGDGSDIRVMFILETQALENKGAHYYENGYRCPSSSKALYTRTDQEKQDEQVEHQKVIALAGSANASGVSSRTHSPASSRGGGASPANGHRRSIDQQNHALFMRVDREENEEQNDFSELWGLRSWPAVFCYPEGSSPPLDHWPNIVSLIMDNRSALDSVRPVFLHSERRQKTTYHISRVDEAMYLVLLAEGVKKSNEKIAQDFMQTVTENLQHSGAFAPRVLATVEASSA